MTVGNRGLRRFGACGCGQAIDAGCTAAAATATAATAAFAFAVLADLGRDAGCDNRDAVGLIFVHVGIERDAALLFDDARIRGAAGVRSNLARTTATAAPTAALALAVSGLFGLAIRCRRARPHHNPATGACVSTGFGPPAFDVWIAAR